MKPNELLDGVQKVVREASQLMYAKDVEVHSKGDLTNLCTSADLNVQHFLYQELRKLLPDSGFLGEEEGLVDIEHPYVWVVDPIDGTANFVRGIPECSISVALRADDRILLGVVYNPYHDHMFTAVEGMGAFLNGNPIHVSDRSFESGLFLTAMSVYNKQYAEICNKIIMDTYYQCNDVRRFGSCAIELCYLACGLCELYFEYRVQAWDYAAAYLILTEAGGILTAQDGGKLHFDSPTMLIGANSPENHRKLCAIVSSHI